VTPSTSYRFHRFSRRLKWNQLSLNENNSSASIKCHERCSTGKHVETHMKVEHTSFGDHWNFYSGMSGIQSSISFVLQCKPWNNALTNKINSKVFPRGFLVISINQRHKMRSVTVSNKIKVLTETKDIIFQKGDA
jgi:hypothetical protein